MRLIRRTWTWFILGLLLSFTIAACNFFQTASTLKQLPAVAPLAMPELPEWIEEISPTGEADPLAQIRIRFTDPVIPLESLDSPEQTAKLNQFQITPELPGEFRFLTPRMVGFQPDEALPKATRIQITLKAGLADLNNHQLSQDLAWTFNTEPLKLTNLPTSDPADEYSEPQWIDLKQPLEFTSNVPLNLNSLKQHVKLVPVGRNEGVSLQVDSLDSEEALTASSVLAFDPSLQTWDYQITPQQELEKGTEYRVEITPGLEPARGNLVSQHSFTSQVKTYEALQFQEMELYGKPEFGFAYGRFLNGAPQLTFNNVIDPESVENQITINPPPKSEPKLIQAHANSNEIRLNPWALEPATQYTINIGSDVQDKYGQKLGQPITLNYQTGDLAAEIWAPSDLNVFPSSKDLELTLSAVNLPNSAYKAAYRIVEPTDLVFTDSAYPRGNGTDLLPDPNNWQSFPISSPPKNQTATVAIPLRERLGGTTGLLAYGIQGRTNSYQENGQQKWSEPTSYGLVQLTNLGVFAQWFPDTGLVKVNHLSDGSAVGNARVEIYQSQTNATTRSPVTPCTTGTTNATGLLVLNSQQVQRCRQSAEEAPELLAVARENQDWAYTRIWSYSGAYGYGIDGEWNAGGPLSRGTIFSDRQLYKPGETAEFTAVAYYQENGDLIQHKNAAYTVTLRDPEGNETALGTQTTNEFGTFSLEVPLGSDLPLGYYSLVAKSNNNVELNGEFRIAEFKPPNFQVQLNLDKTYALSNEKIQAKAESNYLFGSPVAGGNAKYYITRSPEEFTPPGWTEFSFGRQWFWPEEQPELSSEVLQQTARLDNSGFNTLNFTIDRDLPYPMTYRIDAEVTDISNLSVANSQTLTALPSDKLIGVKTNFVADAGKPFSIEAIVTDPSGTAINGQTLRVELQKMDYSSVTRVVEGSRTPRYQVDYETVATETLKTGNTPKTVSITPPEAGSYRIRVNLANAKTDATATDVQIWATGTRGVSWGRRSDRENFLEVKLDKDTYQPGEIATALIQSPYPEAELYFAVVRDQPLYQTITKVSGGAPQIQFKVTPEMLPNAAVEAVLIRQGPPLDQVEPANVEDLVKIGFAPFKTDLGEKYLTVQVTPTQATVQPGTQETVQLQVTDSQNRPVQGQLTLMVVNEAVLQLTGYRPPNLVDTVYAEQPISTRWSDNRFDVVLSPLSSPLQKGWGYGGGFSAGSGSTEIRTEFKPLAYYNGSVMSDRNGRATVSFPLPDDLTTWRVMAVATTTDMRFGNGDNTFISSKPLMATPLLPQFVRPGDRFSGGLALTNTTGEKGRLQIQGAVSENLYFADDTTTSQSFQTEAASGTRAYRFPMQASTLGEGTVRFVSQLNRQGDAFEVPLSVKQLSVSETVVETGTTENQANIPLNIDNNVLPNVGGLQIDLASTLIPEITAPARDTFAEDSLPFLEPAASQLSVAANLQILGQKYPQALGEFNPPEQAAIALDLLQKLQQPDGGFAAYPGQTQSDPFLTAYAAESLSQGRTAGFAVDEAMVSRLRGYLQKTLADPGQYSYCTSQSCKNRVRLGALMALSELGERRNDFLADIYAQRNDLDAVAQTKLARYLGQFPEWQTEAQSLSNQRFETVAETGRSATVNLPQGWGWLSSATTAQAQTLRLAIAKEANPTVRSRLLQGLLNQRREGTWENSYANAEALSALVAYSNSQPTPPNFTATANLGGNTLDSMQFQGYENSRQFIQVAMDSLPKGQTNLTLNKTGNGTLHYLVEYGYRLPGNQPGRYNGLRVQRNISPVGGDKAIAQFGLAKPDKNLVVDAGQVFDIGLEIISDRPVDHVVITDPLPAGFEAVDSSFQTTTSAVKSAQSSWEIGYQNLYSDRIVAYADRLQPGVYTLHYLVRSVTPGIYEWPGAHVHLQYAPEEFGRSASSSLEVKE
ncbi:alpha-2-macroglobulin family protein [Oscillatoria acuminata]|uniref:Large extracellular alpha-helical protein n=1 Tax=Oscillatoria acuminata PCC 6304 TaxID=56110 RepID=K9TKE7_9CYAN|nr:alpha-2-macroglobulin [Oscillatoria acuminata]AFY83020.1 large extracellular alpha-helical protein [Oscillatoria acuminata PCC 6304]